MFKKNKKSIVEWPSPFEVAVILTLLIIILAIVFTEKSPTSIILSWGDGLWSLLAFMAQMCLILLSGFVLASSRPIQKILELSSALPQTSAQVLVFTFVVSAFLCWVNWGLGLVASAFLARRMSHSPHTSNYPLLVAASYMGFIFWHGGLSGSIPLLVSGKEHFSAHLTNEAIPLSLTTFSLFNILLILTLLTTLVVVLLMLNHYSSPNQTKIPPLESQYQVGQTTNQHKGSYLGMYWLLIGLFISYIFIAQLKGQFSMGLNQMILIFIILGMIFHGHFSSYMQAVSDGCTKLGPILVQYPLYAGIMGVMIDSGLALKISQAFVGVSTTESYPVFAFLSAGLVNLFVPSGGGQWAVQAPIVMDGARQLAVPAERVILAVAWGDAWTNLAQPFWAIPLLSLAGLSLKHIAGYCLTALAVSGLVISSFFYFF
jgi:short-chain fatty acids transporter